jgi:two-component sensor histidine kinase
MKSTRRASLLTALGCSAVAAALWVATALVLSQLERYTLDDAAATRRGLARSLAEYEASSIRAIDLSLSFLRDQWRRNPAELPAAVVLHEGLLRKEKVIQVALLDAAGNLAYSRMPQPGPVNFSDREYFAFHRGDALDRLHISAPVFGRVTRQWAIQFSRAIRDASGALRGVIVMAVPPPPLEGIFRDIDLGAGGVVTLVREDGQVLARTSGFEQSAGSRLSRWGPDGAPAEPAGEFRGPGALDGVERFFSYRRIPEYGLIVVVGQAVPMVLEPYAKQRAYLVAAAGAATLFLLAIAAVIMLRIRDHARFSRRHEDLMLELHDGCIQAIYAVGLRLHGARQRAASEPDAVARIIAEAEADLDLVIQELRAFIAGGRGVRYDAGEFIAQVQRAIPRTHRSIFSLDIDPGIAEALAPKQSEHVLRIVREAASNVARHAQAGAARVVLQRRDERLVLRIDDDGQGAGAAPRAPGDGLGVAHIHARAKRLGGKAVVETTPGQGTRVTVEFPP